MKHQMNLKPYPFSQIASEKKTIELRLYDEKRQKIAIDDEVEFTCEDKRLNCRVIALHRFSSFAELYAKLPLEKCGYNNPDEADPDDMLLYYSEQEQKRYGVVGIEIELM